MKAHSIEKILHEASVPAPDPEARLRAKRAALEEFARVRSLRIGNEESETDRVGSLPGAQPPVPWTERYGTARFRRPLLSNLLAGAATACVTGLTAMLLALSLNPDVSMQYSSPSREGEAMALSAPPQPAVIELEIAAPLHDLPAPAELAEPDLVDVSVTGSRIGRINTEVASPVFTVGQDEFTGRDAFPHFATSPVKRVVDEPVSTFSADVDTVSYSFSRRQLNEGVLPQKDAVRAEEMINYFDYAWPGPEARVPPFKATIAVGDSPWGAGKKLVHIGIRGYELAAAEEPDANLVLLLDVSGSMDSPDKLPLAQQSMELLVARMKPTDTVAIVVYAGAAGVVLEPTEVRNRDRILEALRALEPGGSTAGAAGIKQAYELAAKHFRKDGVNRVLLATDGDFNVGITDIDELRDYVERERAKGIFLSVLGFGQGNYRDETAQALAQNGNGVAAYIDTLSEARKVLVEEATSSLFTIARDVKLQVEFNPATVAEYRLVGYETRALEQADFNNDAVDAGDIGSGHSVTAIYEITPAGSAATLIDDRRYAPATAAPEPADRADEYGYLRIRYKLPDESESRLIEQPILVDSPALPASLQRDVDFATAVAGFAQLLRGATYTGSLSYEDVIRKALEAKGDDPHGQRAEFVELVRKAQRANGM